jgi:hypothetical protein
MNRNTTGPVGQAQRVDQTDGRCIRHPRTSSNLGRNGSRRTDSLATIPAPRSACGRKASKTSPLQAGQQRSTSSATPAAGDWHNPRQARPLHRPRHHHPHHPPPVLAHGRDERIQVPRETCRNDGATNRPLRTEGTQLDVNCAGWHPASWSLHLDASVDVTVAFQSDEMSN